MLKVNSDHFEENNSSEQKLIRMIPFAINISQDFARPHLILKGQDGDQRLTVFLEPVMAGLAFWQSQNQNPSVSPFSFGQKILESFQVSIEKCIFCEIKNGVQYVRLVLENHPGYGSMKFRAEEVLPQLLEQKIPLFAVPAVLQKSQVLALETQELERALVMTPQVFKNPHSYLQ